MTTGSILLAIALLIVVLLFVARPFLLPADAPPHLSEQQALLDQKEALLARIKALDFDAETGKLETADYEAEREMLMRRATAVLQQLDEVEDIDAEIEAAVQRLRPQTAVPAVNFCPQCGSPVAEGDKFCTHCGQRLSEATE